VSWLETLAADLAAAVRALRATPAFSAAAVAMLAVGIGVNVAVFTVVGATLFKGYRGVPDNDRLVYVNQWRRGVYSGLLTAFAGLALCLAGAGIFAVLAGAVAQRRQEIGVRMAIGAGRGDVLKMVLREGLTPVVAGLLLGLAAAIGTNRMLAAQLVDVTPADPLALVGAAATLLAAAVVGCVVPARRASRVDPLIALRHG
jgi:ABC-type antimicrobial peptide transport system permease subunit